MAKLVARKVKGVEKWNVQDDSGKIYAAIFRDGYNHYHKWYLRNNRSEKVRAKFTTLKDTLIFANAVYGQDKGPQA